MKKKIAVAVLLVLVILGLAAGAIWYINVPHTPQQAFERAAKLENKVRADAVTQPLAQIDPELKKCLRLFRDVSARFGKSPQAEDALGHIAKLDEEIAKQDSDSLAALDELAREYTDEDHVGPALLEEARLIRKNAESLKTTPPLDQAEKRFHDALDKLNEYLKRFPAGKNADAAIMEQGRIWQDGLGSPPIHAIDSFKTIMGQFPKSRFRSEALFRLGELYELTKNNELAMQAYGQLLDEDPKSEWGEKALLSRGKLLAEKMDKPKEAEADLRRFLKEHPDSPMSGTARSAMKAARKTEADQANEKFGKGRYGGQLPYDTTLDKPIPPAALLAQFARQKLEAKQYDLDIDFVPAEQKITVHGTLQVKNAGDDKTQFMLQLADGMNVGKTQFNGTEVDTEHDGETWLIKLKDPWKSADTATLTFSYTGQFDIPRPNVSPELLKAAAEETKGSSGGIGPPPVGPSTAPASASSADLDQPPKYPPNMQLALGDYGYGLSGAAWYPVTIIGNIFQANLRFHIPQGYEVIAQGVIDKRSNGEFIFHTEKPVFGLYFAYGNYVVREEQIGAIKYYTYLKPEDAEKSEGLIKTASDILNFYSEKYAGFPYEKMALVEVPLPPFLGGVGPASLMMLHQNMVGRAEVPTFLLAHELAHQWFGNMIPINLMDPGYNQWLSEGFATYSDALYTEKTDGPDGLAKYMEKYGQLYFQYTLDFPDSPIRTTYSGPMYRPIIYEKGAIVLHALRKVMGDDKFFLLMRTYAQRFANKPTTVDDFRHLAGEVSGQDLSWFFDEWINRPGYAHWVFDKVDIAPAAGGGTGDEVTMTIEQPDDLIKMPVDITFLGAKDTQRFVAANVMLDQLDQKVVESVPFAPVKIILDEKYWVLHHPGNDNIWPLEARKPTGGE